jgi:hypothetical protein
MKEKIGQRWRYNGNPNFVVEVVGTNPAIQKQKIIQYISGDYYVGEIYMFNLASEWHKSKWTYLEGQDKSI